jgi:hypothetical protein
MRWKLFRFVPFFELIWNVSAIPGETEWNWQPWSRVLLSTTRLLVWMSNRAGLAVSGPARPGPYSGVGSSPIKKGRKNGSGLSLKSSQPKLLLLECVEQNTLLCLLLVSYFSFVLISDQTSPFWYQKIPEMFEDLWELVFCFIFFFAYCFFLLYA